MNRDRNGMKSLATGDFVFLLGARLPRFWTGPAGWKRQPRVFSCLHIVSRTCTSAVTRRWRSLQRACRSKHASAQKIWKVTCGLRTFGSVAACAANGSWLNPPCHARIQTRTCRASSAKCSSGGKRPKRSLQTRSISASSRVSIKSISNGQPRKAGANCLKIFGLRHSQNMETAVDPDVFARCAGSRV